MTDSVPYKVRRTGILALWLVVAVACGLRFCNLDGKVLWRDEVETKLYLCGFGDSDVWCTFQSHQPVSVRAFEKYQTDSPKKTWPEILNVLTVSRQEKLSIYYFLLESWAHCFGASVASVRCFSALLSLLALPCAWWCAYEFFNSRLAANIFLAFFAVSPFHLLYAQEAREYSLWTATILLCSACLFWAIRRSTKSTWFCYTIALILCCYSHALGALVVLAHALYMVCSARRVGMDVLKRFGVAVSIAILVDLPVPLLILAHSHDLLLRSRNYAHSVPLQQWLSSMCLSATQVFVDFNNSGLAQRSPALFKLQSIVVASLLFFEAFSLNRLIRSGKSSAWLICIMCAVNLLPFVIPDLVFGGARTSNPRYLVPCLLGLQLSVAYLFYANWRCSWRWRAGAVALAVASLVSATSAAFASDWWNKPEDNLKMRQVAAYINQHDKPTVIMIHTASDVTTSLGLCRLLRRDAMIISCNKQLDWTGTVRNQSVFVYIPDEPYMHWETHLRSQPGPQPKTILPHTLFEY